MEGPLKKDEPTDGVSEPSMQSHQSARSRLTPPPQLQPENNPSESVSWLLFDGKEGLSSHEFVQQVQRTAFQQGKQRDDEWVADFAATSFSGEALEWYVSLDEEAQTSWRKLRAGLIQRWPVKSEETASDEAYLDPAATPRPTSYRTLAEPSLGRIKVQRDNGVDMGYLAPGSKGRCIIQTEAAKALVVANPQQVHPGAPCRIFIVSPLVTLYLASRLGNPAGRRDQKILRSRFRTRRI